MYGYYKLCHISALHYESIFLPRFSELHCDPPRRQFNDTPLVPKNNLVEGQTSIGELVQIGRTEFIPNAFLPLVSLAHSQYSPDLPLLGSFVLEQQRWNQLGMPGKRTFGETWIVKHGEKSGDNLRAIGDEVR